MKLTLELDGDRFEVDVQRTDRGVRVECEGTVVDSKYNVAGDTVELSVGDRVHRLRFGADDVVEIDGQRQRFLLTDFVPEAPAGLGGDHGSVAVRAAMPGRIVKVLAETGGHIDKGRPLFILEAMKMQNELVSPWTGRVVELMAKVGDVVEAGRVLAKLDTGVRKG